MFRNNYEHERKRAGNAFGSGLLAATLGAAITYFFYGTKEGTEKRERIRNYAGKMKNKMEEASGAMGELKNTGKEFYENMASLFKDKYEDIKNLNKDEVGELAQKIRGHWEDMREDIENAVDESEAYIASKSSDTER